MGLLSLLAQTNGAPEDDIADIRPPYFFLGSWLAHWWWLLLLVLAAAMLAAVLWVLLRSRRPLSAKSAYELALEKLERARGLIREDEPIPYALMISETIRSYLSQRFHAPSTRRTTEEFLRQMEADRATPLAAHHALLREFLQACDLVKFARYQPRLAELEQVQQRAYDFVLATRPSPTTTTGERNGSHAS